MSETLTGNFTPTINFNEIPPAGQLLVPGVYIEIDADYSNIGILPFPAHALVIGQGIFAGSGQGNAIYIAAPGPTVASDQLITAVQSYLGLYNTPDGVRPVTARALVYGSTFVPVNITVSLNPNTALTQAAASAALALFFQQSAGGGATIFMSRLDNALSTSDGEYSHERSEPTADVTCSAQQMLVLGTVTFQ